MVRLPNLGRLILRYAMTKIIRRNHSYFHGNKTGGKQFFAKSRLKRRLNKIDRRSGEAMIAESLADSSPEAILLEQQIEWDRLHRAQESEDINTDPYADCTCALCSRATYLAEKAMYEAEYGN